MYHKTVEILRITELCIITRKPNKHISGWLLKLIGMSECLLFKIQFLLQITTVISRYIRGIDC